MAFVAVLIVAALTHLWCGALSREGAARVHRLAIVSAVLGLFTLLAFAICVGWASLTFPPSIYGHDALLVVLTGAIASANLAISIGLSIALHLRSNRGQA